MRPPRKLRLHKGFPPGNARRSREMDSGALWRANASARARPRRAGDPDAARLLRLTCCDRRIWLGDTDRLEDVRFRIAIPAAFSRLIAPGGFRSEARFARDRRGLAGDWGSGMRVDKIWIDFSRDCS